MDRVYLESIRVNCPLLTVEFVRCQALESFEPSPKVVGVDKVSQVLSQLSVIVVMGAFDYFVLLGELPLSSWRLRAEFVP